MKKFTTELVNNYANKLLIGLTPEENEMVLKEFDIIEENMELITAIPNLSEVEPMTHTLDDFTFTLREDIKEESVDIDDLLSNCDRFDGSEIEVPKVVD